MNGISSAVSSYQTDNSIFACKIFARSVFAFCLGLLPFSLVHAEVIELEGTVKAVDAATRVITIERKTPSGTKTLKLEVARKAGELGNVKAGDRLEFGYDPNLEIVTSLGGGAKPTDAAIGPPSWDADSLLKSVEAIVEQLSQGSRNKLRTQLARTYAERRDYPKAQQEISQIEEPRQRSRAALLVVAEMAKLKDHKEARELAAAVQEDVWREEALLRIIQEESTQHYRVDHDKLIADLLSDVSDSYRSASLRLRLVKSVADKSKQNRLLAKALQYAKTVRDERSRDSLLQNTLESYLRLDDFPAARKVAPLISEGRRKWGFSNVAREYCRDGRVAEGDKVLREGFGVDWLSNSPIERAIAEAGDGDLRAIESEVSRFPDPWKRLESFAGLGAAYTARGQGQDAVRCLGKVSRLVPNFRGNQRAAGEEKALELASGLLAKGLQDQGLGLQIARAAPTLGPQHLLRLCNAYIDGGFFDEALRLIENDLEDLRYYAILNLSESEVRSRNLKQMPKWISAMDSSLDKAWAYLGCHQGLIEASSERVD